MWGKRRAERRNIYAAMHLFDAEAADVQEQIDREGVWWRRLLMRCG